MRVLVWRMDPTDALAWERVDARYRRRNRAAYAAALLGGMYLLKVLSGHFQDLKPLHSLPMAFVVLAVPSALVWLVLRHDLHRRARARLEAPVDVRLEVGPDRVAEWRAGREKPVAFGPRALREVRATAGHVFLSTGADVVIVPRRAFASAADMAAFAGVWAARVE